MPKRKSKKEKASEEARDAPSPNPTDAPATGATPNEAAAESVAGRAGALLPGGPAILNKAPTASGQLPPILKTGASIKDKDPNAKLLGNSEMDEMEQ